jgi:hypothetical protein
MHAYNHYEFCSFPYRIASNNNSDQCTGAIPGPSTNDKAGSSGLLTRFVSQSTIKENFYTIDDFRYPSNLEESEYTNGT